MLSRLQSSTWASWTLTVIVLVVLAGLGAIVLWAAREAALSNPEIIVSVATLVIGGLFAQRRQLRVEREKIAEVRREKIAPLALDLFSFIRRTGRSKDIKVKREDERMLLDVQNGLMLWASPPVVECWARMMRIAEEGGSNEDSLIAMTAMIHAVREELGHDDQGLAVRDLMRLLVTDIDKTVSEEVKF